jgi:hypothetical protein
MFQRKLKVWWIKRKLRLKRETQILTIPDLINLEQEAHKQFLKAGRSGPRDESDYRKGFRDGIRAIWTQKVK